MPYKIIQHGDKFSVVAENTGYVAGTHPSKAKAQAQMAALYANEPEARKEKMNKSEGGYKPTSGMKSAARKAIKFKEDGKANGAGTNVGWTRAHQLVNGESLSLDTVKRMFSFFSRHEVDKKGQNWGSKSDPSNGYIMWLAWGGDAGFSWSRAICNREKKIKKDWDGAFSPIQKQEISKCMTCGCDDLGNDHHYISDTEKCLSCFSKGQGPCWDGYEYAGTKEQDGKTVPNCIPESKKKVNKSIIAGGSDWSIEFSTPDCQHGWAILKGGTAQSIGCYTTKEAAEEALSGLKNNEINILGNEVRTTKTPEEFKEDHIPLMNKSIWDGVFAPPSKGIMGIDAGSQNQDDTYYFPSKAAYENDGKPSAGYGNRSSSDAIPEGGQKPIYMTKPGNRTWE